MRFQPQPTKVATVWLEGQKKIALGWQKGISLAGNRTPASCELFFRMTSRNTDHYTTKDDLFDESDSEYMRIIPKNAVNLVAADLGRLDML
jgi:hypothetical protein